MDDDCLIVSEDLRSPPEKLKVNPLRKTKQACLPFVSVPAKSRAAAPAEPKSTPGPSRRGGMKRKHSGSAQCADEQPKPKKCNAVSSVSRTRKRASPDVEVSSSSDEVIPLPCEGKSPSSTPNPVNKQPRSPLPSRTVAFLQKFVKKKPTQQDEVSTSVGETSDKNTPKKNTNSPVNDVEEAIILEENGGDMDKNDLSNKHDNGDDAEADDVIESESHCDESKNAGKTNKQTAKMNSILEAIDIVVNRNKFSVEIRSEDREAAEKEMANQNKKRKLSCDSGKSPSSEKENIAKSPSSKKSKNLLTAFIKRGVRSSLEPAARQESPRDGLVTSPGSSKSNSNDNESIASREEKNNEPEMLRKNSIASSSKAGRKLASNVKTDDKSSCSKEKTGSSSSVHHETRGLQKPEVESLSEVKEKSPSESAIGNESSECVEKSPSGKSNESHSGEDDKSPSSDEDASPSRNDDRSPNRDDDESPSMNGDKPPSRNDGTPPSRTDRKSPSEDKYKSEKTPAGSGVRSSGHMANDHEANRSSGAETPKLPCKKLTPKALAKLAEKKQREELRLLKQEEKLKQKQEKEEEKAKKEAERLKAKEEKKAELEKQRKEKEEQRKKKQEEHDAKSKEREEKRKKAEEEKRLKEEEKRAKEEERRKAEQEEEERKKKVAEKFVNFFKAGKEEPSSKTVPAKHHSGPFEQMQVSRYTALAPVQRVHLSEESLASLDKYISSSNVSRGAEVRTYVDLLRSGDHKPLSSPATPPAVVVKDDKEDCVIIEQEADDDEDEDDLEYAGEGMVVCEKGAVDPKNHKGKLLKFCENRRPAYWGTWTKKPTAVRPRRPFAKEEIFDYEYDSDDDWEEEEENGESLSDSEGEKEDDDDEQYEVDNDFFVPHGYLSDDEGQEDEDNFDDEGGARDEAEHKESTGLVDHKEKLKAKQAEFEKELKKQTKQLKPRVLGCLWLHEKEQSSGAAYEHLHRVMSGYAAVVCVPPPADHDLPSETEGLANDASAAVEDKNSGVAVRSWYLTFPGIPCLAPATPQPDVLATPSAAVDADTPMASTGANGSQKRKFFKTFPEEAIPSLIRLTHGNRNGQLYIVREFLQYWHKRDQSEPALKKQDIADSPRTSLLSPRVKLSKKKVKDKLNELASYKRCPDDGPFNNQSMWYVDESVRQQYGVEDISLPNDWSYCTSVPKSSRTKEDGSSVGESPAPSRAVNLISKFTKVLSDEEKAVLISKKNGSQNTQSSRSDVEHDDDICEVKVDSGGAAAKNALLSGRKRSKDGSKPAKSSAKTNPKKVSTPVSKKAAKSSPRLTPKNSPLLAFFKTPRSSESKKPDSKHTRVKTQPATKDAPSDDQCITID